MPIPDATFTSWFPWAHIDGTASPDLAAKLSKVGCYLIAIFDGEVPAGAAEVGASEVIYIGETHGDTCSLWGRLGSFGNSAGFYGHGQKNGHYAAWRFPAVPGAVGDEVSKGRWKCRSHNVFVAVCPWEKGPFGDKLRGLFPTFVEQQALWAFTSKHADLPRLNNTGRVRVLVVPPMPAITDAEIAALLNWAQAPSAGEAAAVMVAERLAVAMNYDPPEARLVPVGEYGKWTGAERRLDKGNYLYIGKSAFLPNAATLTAFERERCTVDTGESATVAEFRKALAAFWDYWSPS